MFEYWLRNRDWQNSQKSGPGQKMVSLSSEPQEMMQKFVMKVSGVRLENAEDLKVYGQ